jgi:cytochrome P450
LIELQKRPDVLARLMTEIESIEAIDFTTVTTKMPYLDAVIMEINRLYPSVPATLRVIERETRLRTAQKPVVLKPGMLIYLSYLHMHTSPKYWGADAGEFDPDRFLNGGDKGKPFMAFGSGTRDCVSVNRENLWSILATYIHRLVINLPS